MSEQNTHGQGPNDPHPGTRTTPPAAPRPCEFGADGMCIHHDHCDADGERRVLPRPVSPEAARGDTWRCAAQRSHGVCNSFNDIDEETCGACGADRPEAAPPRATTAPMTEERLATLRARNRSRGALSIWEIDELLAEVDRLRASSPSRESGALLDAAQQEIARFWEIIDRIAEIIGAEESDLDIETAVQMYVDWATGNLAASDARLSTLERDAARMRAIDDDLDDLRWIRPSFHADGPLVELDWFVGDGGGSTLTTGATISEAVDAYLAALTPSGETIRCAACGRECEPINDSDAPVTHCVDCAVRPSPPEGPQE